MCLCFSTHNPSNWKCCKNGWKFNSICVKDCNSNDLTPTHINCGDDDWSCHIWSYPVSSGCVLLNCTIVNVLILQLLFETVK